MAMTDEESREAHELARLNNAVEAAFKTLENRTTAHNLACGHTLITYGSTTSATLERHRKTCGGTRR